MSSNLIARLRKRRDVLGPDTDCAEAADEIERLRARAVKLEDFIQSLAYGPPYVIEPLYYINSLIDKARQLCPKEDEEEGTNNVVLFDRS